MVRILDIVDEGILSPLPEAIKPVIPIGGVVNADQMKVAPETSELRKIVSFCDPEQIVWLEGVAIA
jgi:hypothetical protein